MSNKSKNLVMVDFADRDPRSFKAHMRGAGDGRQQQYEKLLAAQSGDDLGALQSKFATQVWDAKRKSGSATAVVPKVAARTKVLAVVVPVVGLLLGVMLFQVFVA